MCVLVDKKGTVEVTQPVEFNQYLVTYEMEGVIPFRSPDDQEFETFTEAEISTFENEEMKKLAKKSLQMQKSHELFKVKHYKLLKPANSECV